MNGESLPPGWPDQLPDAFYTGLAQLNGREYFACHETLEPFWIAESSGVREVYQAVIQIAVGCFHLCERSNWRGAVGKLDAGARRLERAILAAPALGQAFYGVDWPALIAAADRLHAHLRQLGPAGVAAFDPALLPVARMDARRAHPLTYRDAQAP